MTILYILFVPYEKISDNHPLFNILDDNPEILYIPNDNNPDENPLDDNPLDNITDDNPTDTVRPT